MFVCACVCSFVVVVCLVFREPVINGFVRWVSFCVSHCVLCLQSPTSSGVVVELLCFGHNFVSSRNVACFSFVLWSLSRNQTLSNNVVLQVKENVYTQLTPADLSAAADNLDKALAARKQR